MPHITVRSDIEAPVERVFGYVDDHRHTIRYMRGLTLWSPTTDVVHGKGAEFEVVMKAGPANLRSIVRISAWTENRTIAWRSVDGFRQSGRWGFGRHGDRTEVILDLEYEFGGGIAGRMLSRVAEPAFRHNLEQSVIALTQLVERLRPTGTRRATAKPGASPGARTVKRTATQPRKPTR
jgi:uncharacterized membrane protein